MTDFSDRLPSLLRGDLCLSRLLFQTRGNKKVSREHGLELHHLVLAAGALSTRL